MLLISDSRVVLTLRCLIELYFNYMIHVPLSFILFLQMLGYFQHFKLDLHYQTLFFWLVQFPILFPFYQYIWSFESSYVLFVLFKVFFVCLIWQALLRDLLLKPKVIQHAAVDSSLNNLSSGSKQADDGKMNILSFLNEDIFSIMLEITFQRMVKKERVQSGTAYGIGALELWSDDIEGKGDFSQYRSRLVRLPCLCF